MTAACTETRAIAAELALGIAEGHQRATALEHLATCATCRAEVDHLAATADSLLLIAPGAEPPAGFETTVLSRLDDPAPASAIRRRRRPGRRFVAVAAAAAVLVFAVGLGIGRWTADRSTPGAGIEQVAVGSFVEDGGAPFGEVRAFSGEPSLLVVTLPGPAVSPALSPGDYRVECTYRNGRSYTAGTLTIAPDQAVAAWSSTVGYRLDGLDQVRLVAADGTDLVATLDHSG